MQRLYPICICNGFIRSPPACAGSFCTGSNVSQRQGWRYIRSVNVLLLTEWSAVVLNIGYVILAARQDRRCWLLGMGGAVLSCVVYIWSRLYSDATLQVFYFGMAVYGWVVWTLPADGQFRVRIMSVRLHGFIGLAGVTLGMGLGWFWSGYGADYPYLDGLTTSFSILATWLTARRFLQSWIYWIFINLTCIGLYAAKGLYAFVFLFMVYTLLAAYGYRAWQRSQ
jgi:nicotinamide mononucleotide transporter